MHLNKKATSEKILFEAGTLILAILFITGMFYYLSNTLGFFNAGKDQDAAIASFNTLTTHINNLLTDTTPYAHAKGLPVHIPDDYLLVFYENNINTYLDINHPEGSTYQKTYLARPTICAGKMCLCLIQRGALFNILDKQGDGIFTSTDNQQRQDIATQKKDSGIITCNTYNDNTIVYTYYFSVAHTKYLFGYRSTPREETFLPQPSDTIKNTFQPDPAFFPHNTLLTTTNTLFIDKTITDGVNYILLTPYDDYSKEKLDERSEKLTKQNLILAQVQQAYEQGDYKKTEEYGELFLAMDKPQEEQRTALYYLILAKTKTYKNKQNKETAYDGLLNDYATFLSLTDIDEQQQATILTGAMNTLIDDNNFPVNKPTIINKHLLKLADAFKKAAANEKLDKIDTNIRSTTAFFLSEHIAKLMSIQDENNKPTLGQNIIRTLDTYTKTTISETNKEKAYYRIARITTDYPTSITPFGKCANCAINAWANYLSLSPSFDKQDEARREIRQLCEPPQGEKPSTCATLSRDIYVPSP